MDTKEYSTGYEILKRFKEATVLDLQKFRKKFPKDWKFDRHTKSEISYDVGLFEDFIKKTAKTVKHG